MNEFFDDPGPIADPREATVNRAEDVAAVSAALSRMVSTGEAASSGSLMERLSGIRSRSNAVLVSDGRQTAAVLLRLVNEMKPLLVAARKAGVSIPEVRKLVAEAMEGQDADLSQRVRVVEQVKATLEAALVERIAEELQGVLVDIDRTKAGSAQVHTAELTAAEAVALLDTGNYAAALDRAAKARNALEHHVGIVPRRIEVASGPSSFIAIGGPSIVAVGYVAISAMMLPGITGFLQTNFVLNTSIILALSYGWLGLISYALLSVYSVLRQPSNASTSRDAIDRRR
jgi:hypothetical protein